MFLMFIHQLWNSVAIVGQLLGRRNIEGQEIYNDNKMIAFLLCAALEWRGVCVLDCRTIFPKSCITSRYLDARRNLAKYFKPMAILHATEHIPAYFIFYNCVPVEKPLIDPFLLLTVLLCVVLVPIAYCLSPYSFACMLLLYFAMFLEWRIFWVCGVWGLCWLRKGRCMDRCTLRILFPEKMKIWNAWWYFSK